MEISLADVQAKHGYTHGYPVEVGADPVVTAICDGDIRADFARTGTPPYRRLLDATLADMERESRRALDALAYRRMWGIKAAI